MKTASILLFIFCLCAACTVQPAFNREIVDRAVENGKQANEGYVRSLKFVEGWLTTVDSISGLLPNLVPGMFNNNEGTDRWEPYNTAADNYPFMVLTAYLLDKSLYEGKMKEILQAEKKLTSRVKSLPDIYSLSKRGFRYDELKMEQIVFGTAEYIKDGLIPLNEYLGKSPWQERMFEMLDDLEEYIKDPADIEKLYSRPGTGTVDLEYYHALIEEVNGDMLQTLSRVYRITGNKKYLDWAVRIGDYCLLGERDLSQVEYLRLRDHGCEVIGGLSELYVTLHYADPEKKRQYSEPFYRLLDRVLETGRNEDGIFYNAVNMKTGKVVDSVLVDNWGYIFDAYYSVYTVDNKKEYRQAVLKGVEKLYEKYRNYPWEGKSHDGYADAIESGITIYNREPVAELKSWIDSEMKVMFAMQRPDGIIEGWHGDGNFARTAIMYSLWKSQGATIQPWRSDVMLGAEPSGDEICFTLTAENDWEGKLLFDAPRHKTILHLPTDYPRINQFPEWFTVSEDKTYHIVSSQKRLSGNYSGAQLLAGIPVKIKAGEKTVVSCTALKTPPTYAVCRELSDYPALKAAGYDFFEPTVGAFLSPAESDSVFLSHLAEMKELNAKPVSCTIFLPGDYKVVGEAPRHDEIVDWGEKTFQRANQAGIRYIVFGSGGARRVPEGFDREKAMQQFIAVCKQLATVAQKYDVTLVVEPLNKAETNLINSLQEGAAVIEAVNHPNVRLLCDIYHMMRDNEPASEIVKYGKYIRHCHIAEKETRSAPGTKGDDFKPYFAALKQIGYKGCISIECSWDNFASRLAPALEYMKRQFNEATTGK